MSDLKCVGEGYNDCKGEVKNRRQSTMFHYSEEDRLAGKPDPNMVTCCDSCFEEIEADWAERWSDYYSGLL